MDNKKLILGIGGKKNSGKDTLSEMINYILSVGINVAKYTDWIEFRERYKLTYAKDNVIHFADILKDNLANIFQISRTCFDLREFKDELWYDIRNRIFLNDNELVVEHEKIYMNSLKNFSDMYNILTKTTFAPVIKLRTLMQHYAQLMKAIYGEDIWIRSTINNAIDKAGIYGYSIIADVRFKNESRAIRQISSSTGRLILIERESLEDNDKHCSEECNFDYDYKIENNRTLMKMFYEIQAILYNILTNEIN